MSTEPLKNYTMEFAYLFGRDDRVITVALNPSFSEWVIEDNPPLVRHCRWIVLFLRDGLVVRYPVYQGLVNVHLRNCPFWDYFQEMDIEPFDISLGDLERVEEVAFRCTQTARELSDTTNISECFYLRVTVDGEMEWLGVTSEKTRVYVAAHLQSIDPLSMVGVFAADEDTQPGPVLH